MKTSHSIVLTMAALVYLVLLTSCTPGPDGIGYTQVTPQIDLHVVGNVEELKVITLGSANCKAASPAKGCVAVAKAETALINFELKTSPDWHLTKFIICSGGTKPVYPVPGCSLEDWQQSEFYATDAAGTMALHPDEHGIIDLAPLGDDLTEFYLYDFNSVEHDYFYTIEACSPGATPPCIQTDPPIENGGRY